jgi:HAD superfamily hydrolase (TIGR01450 family)
MNTKSFSDFFASKRFIILDGDGTLYLDRDPIDGSKELITLLNETSKDFAIISNNDSLSYRTRLKLVRGILGVNIKPKRFILPTQPTIDYLKEKKIRSFDGLVTAGLRKDIANGGIRYDEKSPQIIVIGFDTQLTYKKLRRVVSHINGGVDYLVTHTDLLCPTKRGSMPDAGSIFQLIRAATRKEPIVIIGKPFKRIIDYVFKENGLNKKNVLIIGDMADTDVKMAESNDIDSVLIARGNSELRKLKELSLHPSFVFGSLSDMVKAI